ncbi:hypothetical protein [uncultured Bacteroides sp.]|nr:hypothetical protein [uncultured Bacteroides sp.]
MKTKLIVAGLLAEPLTGKQATFCHYEKKDDKNTRVCSNYLMSYSLTKSN